MTVRRVFVIWTHPLFLEAVRRLLDSPQVQWLGAGSDHRAAQKQILSLSPDTVVIESEQGDKTPAQIVKILETSVSDVRVIRLSLSENKLSVYHREHRTVGQAEDLLRLIQNG